MKMIYLDNAATSFPKPRSVTIAVSRFLTEKSANPGRSGHKLSMAAAEEVYKCRAAAAEFFNAEGPECVAFFMNATQAINAALKGFLTKPAHVITSCLEHNAVMRPLAKLAEKGVTYSVANVDIYNDDATVASFENLIKEDTVMIACTHASNVCGKILPIEKLGSLCKARGLKFLVDAAQSAGVIPIDMQKMNIDFLCMPGHKSLYGPMGTGMLITSEGCELDTLIEGGTGSNSTSLEQPDFMPDRLESGTVNAVGIAGLRAGIEYIKNRGIRNIYNEEIHLALKLYDNLSLLDYIKLYTSRPEHGFVPLVSFNVGEASSIEIVAALDNMDFALRGGLHCAPAAHNYLGTLSQGMVRAGFGLYNNREEIQLLVAAIKKIKIYSKNI
jgi:cysteine desulfurase/selenocysteine lyase